MKKATIKDVAREANVSVSVVSYVLNNSTEKSFSEATIRRVVDAANKLNYVPNRVARGLRGRKSLSIGIASYWGMDGMVFMNMLEGINETALESNNCIVLCNTKKQNEPYSYLDYYADGTIDGIIFIAPHESLGLIDEKSHIHRMKEAHVPFVMINGHTDEPDVHYINIDFYGSTYLATMHLIEQGYKEITYVAPLKINFIELKERHRGYKEAMEQHGLQEQVCDVDDIADQIGQFKAIVTNKSDTAHKVMGEALRQKKVIPDDFVLIAGNTEAYSDFLFPPLSTVKIPAKEMGEIAARTLLDVINDMPDVKYAMPKCTIQIRKSC